MKVVFLVTSNAKGRPEGSRGEDQNGSEERKEVEKAAPEGETQGQRTQGSAQSWEGTSNQGEPTVFSLEGDVLAC